MNKNHQNDFSQHNHKDLGRMHQQIWSHQLKKSNDFKFLHWNLSNDYNDEVNDNDDQINCNYTIGCNSSRGLRSGGRHSGF